ncbi:MAG: GGDEF domain-containing protein [Planctomycetes bacterium]|nr:GGDEF domain-containing protein [Planctomycetota bacterium]
MIFFALTDSLQGYLADTVALAAVAVIGYLFGRRSGKFHFEPSDFQLHQELSRATQIAKELQQIAGRIRQDVASHQANISQFKTRVTDLQSQATDDGWQTLSSEAESLLVPTMRLATDLSLAYDQLRKQSLLLMNFAGSRTDPLTGIHNRRAMEEQLEVLLSLHHQNASRFSLALFSLDDCSSTAEADELFCAFVELLESCARDTDVVARYSNEEFVVLMPQTSLAGSVIFSERLLRRAENLPECVVAGGIVEVQAEDDAAKLLSRADSALYSARANGYNCLYQHNGKTLREHEIGRLTETLETDSLQSDAADLECSTDESRSLTRSS